MSVTKDEWIIWWEADCAHCVHPNHKPKDGIGFEPQWDGIAYCGKTIPRRGIYPASPMAQHCGRCRQELKEAKQRLVWQ